MSCPNSEVFEVYLQEHLKNRMTCPCAWFTVHDDILYLEVYVCELEDTKYDSSWKVDHGNLIAEKKREALMIRQPFKELLAEHWWKEKIPEEFKQDADIVISLLKKMFSE